MHLLQGKRLRIDYFEPYRLHLGWNKPKWGLIYSVKTLLVPVLAKDLVTTISIVYLADKNRDSHRSRPRWFYRCWSARWAHCQNRSRRASSQLWRGKRAGCCCHCQPTSPRRWSNMGPADLLVPSWPRPRASPCGWAKPSILGSSSPSRNERRASGQ